MTESETTKGPQEIESVLIQARDVLVLLSSDPTQDISLRRRCLTVIEHLDAIDQKMRRKRIAQQKAALNSSFTHDPF